MKQSTKIMAKSFEYLIILPSVITALIIYFPIFILACLIKKVSNILLYPVQRRHYSFRVYGKLQDYILKNL